MTYIQHSINRAIVCRVHWNSDLHNDKRHSLQLLSQDSLFNVSNVVFMHLSVLRLRVLADLPRHHFRTSIATRWFHKRGGENHGLFVDRLSLSCEQTSMRTLRFFKNLAVLSEYCGGDACGASQMFRIPDGLAALALIGNYAGRRILGTVKYCK